MKEESNRIQVEINVTRSELLNMQRLEAETRQEVSSVFEGLRLLLADLGIELIAQDNERAKLRAIEKSTTEFAELKERTLGELDERTREFEAGVREKEQECRICETKEEIYGKSLTEAEQKLHAEETELGGAEGRGAQLRKVEEKIEDLRRRLVQMGALREEEAVAGGVALSSGGEGIQRPREIEDIGEEITRLEEERSELRTSLAACEEELQKREGERKTHERKAEAEKRIASLEAEITATCEDIERGLRDAGLARKSGKKGRKATGAVEAREKVDSAMETRRRECEMKREALEKERRSATEIEWQLRNLRDAVSK